MGVSKNSGCLPQIINFNRVFHYKPSILGGFPPIFGNIHICYLTVTYCQFVSGTVDYVLPTTVFQQNESLAPLERPCLQHVKVQFCYWNFRILVQGILTCRYPKRIQTHHNPNHGDLNHLVNNIVFFSAATQLFDDLTPLRYLRCSNKTEQKSSEKLRNCLFELP